EELYGKNHSVPLRELVQNGADAVRALRAIPKSLAGNIVVRLGEDNEGEWIDVDDGGIGMSQQVLASSLLDFGQSYWGSDLMRREFPGLLTSEFQPTGRYGVGFFSVFMVAKRVRVMSRRYDAGATDTHVLEFPLGLEGRPILRQAESGERRTQGGTSVRIWPTSPWFAAIAEGKQRTRGQQLAALKALCVSLFPTLDVDLTVAADDRPARRVIAASDWLKLKPEALLRRLGESVSQATSGAPPENMRSLRLASGDVVGRALLWDAWRACPVTVGGAMTEVHLSGLVGFVAGRALRVARDLAEPLVPWAAMGQWATEQARLVAAGALAADVQANMAQTVLSLGGDPGPLRLAPHSKGWLSAGGVATWAARRSRIFLMHDAAVSNEEYRSGKIVLPPDTLVIAMGALGPLDSQNYSGQATVDGWAGGLFSSTATRVTEAVATTWGTDPGALGNLYGPVTVKARRSSEELRLRAQVLIRPGVDPLPPAKRPGRKPRARPPKPPARNGGPPP
ncbi:MAG: ATP-binding protein, partial [Actinobacteria bacterium]|nr:ATP-binding protein [Actinomycetota bacterium]